MLNVRDLERRWLRYKIKSYLPHAVIVASLVIISASLYIYSSSASPKSKQADAAQTPHSVHVKQKTASAPQEPEALPARQLTQQAPQQPKKPLHVKQSHSTPVETTALEEKQTSSKPVVLKPSMDFIKKMRSASGEYYMSEIEPPKEVVLDAPVRKKPKKKTVQKTKKTQVIPEPSLAKKKIVIQRDTTLQDLKDVERRFQKSNKPALSLFLAKQYYMLGDYKKAYNFALLTNQLDKKNETSWLIFSKSLVKMGQRDLAVKTLKEYIKYSHSQNAALLLENIETGKFQ